MRFTLLVTICIAVASSSFADKEVAPIPLVFRSEQKPDVFFTMIPAIRGEDYEIKKKAFGVAYKVSADGSLKELYRTEGWYSFRVFVSIDARYLVRIGPWNRGSAPTKDDLAVAFYKDGKLLKKYSTAELVKDKSKIVQTTSHYFWRAPSPYPNDDLESQVESLTMTDEQLQFERSKLRLHLDYSNIFELHTIDGWTYAFDVSTGKIKSTTRTKG